MDGLLGNLDLLSVGITIIGTIILGFVVLFNNRKSITGFSFLLFCLITSGWGIVNYLNYRIDNPEVAFWFVRLTIFLAVWQAYAIFQLFYVFPQEQNVFPRPYRFFLLPWVFFVSFLTLTPLVFSGISQISSDNRIIGITNGPAIPLFGLTAVGLVVGSLFILIKKIKRAKGSARKQLLSVLTGIVLMFTLIIIFNFLLPVFFNNPYFIPLGATFTLPFLFLTSHAILTRRFLNVRVITTEIFVFILLLIVLLELVQAKNMGEVLIRGLTLIGLIGFGILLIQNAQREVEQRESLEKLTQELEIANDNLRKLDEAKSEFLSIASHQLRTPLSAIKGYISMILEGTYGHLEDKAKKPLQNVYQANERLVKLVNDLLDVSRIEAGRVELEKENVSLENLINGAIDIFKIRAKEKGLYLKLEKNKDLQPVMFLDKQKISQVIMNLIDNAIRYTEKGGIAIRLRQEEKLSSVLIEIKDTGIGIEKEELPELFASFSRGQASSKYWTEGMGFGLYVAKKFVEMHGGKVWAESEGQGKGSAFYVELPMVGKMPNIS